MLYLSFRLPLPVVVDGSCRGLSVWTRFGAARAEMRVPHNQQDDPELDIDDFTLARMSSGDDSPPPATGAVLRDWAAAARPSNDDASPFELCRLLAAVSAGGDKLPPPRQGVGPSTTSRLHDEVTRTANRWHDVLRTWLEVLTMQDLDHVQRRWTAHIEGAGVATFDEGGQRRRGSGHARLDTHDEVPASVAMLRAAIARAGQVEYPPLAHLLLRDARAAYWRGQLRRSVIDAATATELALVELAGRAGLRLRPSATLGVLVKALAGEGAIGPDFAAQLTTLVVKPRNAAVHAGDAPAGWDTVEAVKTAQIVVWHTFPILDELSSATGPPTSEARLGD